MGNKEWAGRLLWLAIGIGLGVLLAGWIIQSHSPYKTLKQFEDDSFYGCKTDGLCD